jgi:hypothetical protein
VSPDNSIVGAIASLKASTTGTLPLDVTNALDQDLKAAVALI